MLPDKLVMAGIIALIFSDWLHYPCPLCACSKMTQFQLFDSVVCNITFMKNIWNLKMSQFGQKGGSAFFKNVWNSKMSQFVKKGGGSAFLKNVWNSKLSQRSEGGEGSTLIGTLSQIFSIFYFDASPNKVQFSIGWAKIYFSFWHWQNQIVSPPWLKNYET